MCPRTRHKSPRGKTALPARAATAGHNLISVRPVAAGCGRRRAGRRSDGAAEVLAGDRRGTGGAKDQPHRDSPGGTPGRLWENPGRAHRRVRPRVARRGSDTRRCGVSAKSAPPRPGRDSILGRTLRGAHWRREARGRRLHFVFGSAKLSEYLCSRSRPPARTVNNEGAS